MNDNRRTERIVMFSSAFFLFGLALLFAINAFWPWILILSWVVSIPILIAGAGRMGLWVSAQASIWLFGLGVLFATHMIWPGVLILAGLSTLLVAIVPPDRIEQSQRQSDKRKAKRKRDAGLPLPSIAHPADEDDGWIADEDEDDLPLEQPQRHNHYRQ